MCDVLRLKQIHRSAKLAIPWRELAVHCMGGDYMKKRESLATGKEILSKQTFWRNFFRARFENSPPVVVTIYKVTDQAGDVVSLGCANDALYQMQLVHTSERSVVAGIACVFDEFLRDLRAKNRFMPGNVVDLHRDGIKLVVTPSVDPNCTGYTPFRVAFYIVGSEASLNTCLHIVLEFVAYKARKLFHKPYDIRVYSHIGINVTIPDNTHVICYAPALILPVGIFEARPVVDMRIITMTVCPKSYDTLALVLSGSTWGYRDGLDAIGAGSVWLHDGHKRSHCRILEVNLQNGGSERVWNMLGDCVFKGLAMRVRVEADLVAGTKVYWFVLKLKSRPQLHFN